MAKFLYVYHGGSMPRVEGRRREDMKAWMDWFGSLGTAVVDGGNPVGKSKTRRRQGVENNDGGANPTGGYSIIEARTSTMPTSKAKGCPIV